MSNHAASSRRLAALFLAVGASVAGADQIYVATFTGTMTHVSESGNPIIGLDVGQGFTFTIRTVVTPEELAPGVVWHDAVSSELIFDDGTPSGLQVPTSGFGGVGINFENTPGLGYAFGAEHRLAGTSPLASAFLWDPDSPFVESGTDLPLTL